MINRIYDNAKLFPPGTLVSMLFIVTCTYAYTKAALLDLISVPWRIMYAFRAIIFWLSSIYIIFLLTGVMGPSDYASATQWILPLILFGSNWIPQLHIWEEKKVKGVRGGLGGSNNRDRFSGRIRRLFGRLVQSKKDQSRHRSDDRRRRRNSQQDAGSSGTKVRRPPAHI